MKKSIVCLALLMVLLLQGNSDAFLQVRTPLNWSSKRHAPLRMSDEKFGLSQRIDSAKSGVLGAIVGSLAQSPATLVHDVLFGSGGVAQWEYDTDAAAVSAGLFAIVYRYCIRTDDNPQLNQGVIGAFVLVRSLSKVTIPGYCSAVPLNCGAPLGYLDWNLLQQLFLSLVESGLMFGLTALAIDVAMEKGFISKFP